MSNLSLAGMKVLFGDCSQHRKLEYVAKWQEIIDSKVKKNESSRRICNCENRKKQKAKARILTKAANQGRVIDCKVDTSLRDKIVLFNDKRDYTRQNDLLFIPYEFILAVV